MRSAQGSPSMAALCPVPGFRVQGLGFRVRSLGFRVSGSGFRV